MDREITPEILGDEFIRLFDDNLKMVTSLEEEMLIPRKTIFAEVKLGGATHYLMDIANKYIHYEKVNQFSFINLSGF